MIICFMVGKLCLLTLLCAHFYGVSHCVLFRKYRNNRVCCITEGGSIILHYYVISVSVVISEPTDIGKNFHIGVV